jgi:plastocyanin
MRRIPGSVLGTALLAASICFVSAAGAATINGTVTFDGKVPNLPKVAMDADPVCAKKNPGGAVNEALVLGDGNTMANIFVRVVKGVPAGKTYPKPGTPVVMDQEACRYHPHVMGIMVGQEFKVKNSDGILHNVHALPKVNKPFNMAMPANRTEATANFEKEEGIFQIKCDVHPWMSAYIAVSSNPFFSVTGKDGKFTISGLDAGTYDLEAWHEKLGVQKATVTVGASDTKAANFKFSPPAGK